MQRRSHMLTKGTAKHQLDPDVVGITIQLTVPLTTPQISTQQAKKYLADFLSARATCKFRRRKAALKRCSLQLDKFSKQICTTNGVQSPVIAPPTCSSARSKIQEHTTTPATKRKLPHQFCCKCHLGTSVQPSANPFLIGF